ncbi:hypothetical protein PIROE2DRAFT_63173 [Piromyces sp. E2]|nr:hypothetical protein PIROE2DRAFT_63173 [Piromyces sp. E2]|eukprot:OUM60380.1 hypothetical protein PIROE2DRAFT_63173 [Piromyces sp. E2]
MYTYLYLYSLLILLCKKKKVKVKIIDSCGECDRSHINLSKYAFQDIHSKKDRIFPVIWIAANTKGEVIRDVVFPSSKTEHFAKSFDLSRSQFISVFKKQALYMIREGVTHATFNNNNNIINNDNNNTNKITAKKTIRKNDITQKASSIDTISKQISKDSIVPNLHQNISTVSSTSSSDTSTNLGDINDMNNEFINDKNESKDISIAGQMKTFESNQIGYSDEDQLRDKKENSTYYIVGIFSGVITISGAVGFGLCMKKQKSNNYVCNNRRKEIVSEDTDIFIINYREMPGYMFGGNGLINTDSYDEPVDTSFPESKSYYYKYK